MKNITHYIDGQLVDGIRNWMDFEITIDFELESVSDSGQQLEFVGEANEVIRAIIDSGVTGGVGIFEGIPYRVVISEDGVYYAYDGFIDLSSDLVFLGNDGISAMVNRKQGETWLNDVSDGFGISSMIINNEIVDSDYTEIRYVINYKPDVFQIATLSLSIFILSNELVRMVKDVIKDRTEHIADLIPLGGFGIVFNVGRGAWHIAMAIVEVIYIIAVLVGMVFMVKSLLEQLLPKSGVYRGFTIRNMFQLCCNHLNLTLKSDLLDSVGDLVYLPPKSDEENGVVGTDTLLDSFGEVIRTFKSMFNADFRIEDGVFRFERRDFFDYEGGFIMPDIFSNQEELKDNFSFNTDEFISNYNINFRIDSSDENTFEHTDGLSFQSSLSALTVKDKKLSTIKGLSTTSLPFSLGMAKSGINIIEEMGKRLGSTIDAITGIFGSGTNFVSDINERDGALLLSNDYFYIPKVVFVRDRGIYQDISAKWLWDNYHFINSFSPDYAKPNQWKIHEETRIPINVSNIVALLKNNSGVMPDGTEMTVSKLIWKPYEDVAVVTYRERFMYTNNLKEKKS